MRGVAVSDRSQHLLIHRLAARTGDRKNAIRVVHKQRRATCVSSQDFVCSVDRIGNRDDQSVEIRSIRIPRDRIAVRNLYRAPIFNVVDDKISSGLAAAVVRVQVENRSRPDDYMVGPKFRRVTSCICGRCGDSFAHCNGSRHVGVEARVAAGIGGNQHKAQVSFSLAVAARICKADTVRKELNAILRGRFRAERSFHMHAVGTAP